MNRRNRRHPGTLGAPLSASVRDPSDGVPLPGRAPAVLLATVGMTAVFGAGAVVGLPMTERHLRSDIARHVLADVPSVRAKVSGRAVSLVGSVASIDDRSELGDRVRSRWGVASVTTDGLTVVGIRPAAAAAKQTSAAGPSVSGLASGRSSRSTAPAATTRSNGASPGAGRTTTPPVRPPGIATNRATPLTGQSTSPTTGGAFATVSSSITVRSNPDPVAAAALQQRLTAIRRATPIVFVRSSPAVSPSATKTLDRIAQEIGVAGLAVRIEAHSDGSGNTQTNLQLSIERATAVRDALLSRGVSPELLVAVGRGDTVPIASNATARGRDINRRIEFVVNQV